MMGFMHGWMVWTSLLTLAFAVCVVAEQQPDGGFIFTHNERSEKEMIEARAAVPVVEVSLEDDRHDRLPRTMRTLRGGGTLRVVMLGDSIINDTARSAWHERVEAHYGEVDITRVVSVGNGTGCWWFREDGRIERYVLDQEPDLLIIGGISHRHDVASIRDCLQQVRAGGSDAEILLMTGPFGTHADPMSGPDWRQRTQSGKDQAYARQLAELADQFNAAYFDMQRAWGEYLRELDQPKAHYMRDRVHANARGEAVLGRIMEQYFMRHEP